MDRVVVVDAGEVVVALVEQPAPVVAEPALWGAVVVVGWDVLEPVGALEPPGAPAPGAAMGWVVVVVVADGLPDDRPDPRSWPRGSRRLEVSDGPAFGELEAAGGLAPAACNGPPTETAPAKPTSVSPAAPAVRARRLPLAPALSTMAGEVSALAGRYVGRPAEKIHLAAMTAWLSGWSDARTLSAGTTESGLVQAGTVVVGSQFDRLAS